MPIQAPKAIPLRLTRHMGQRSDSEIVERAIEAINRGMTFEGLVLLEGTPCLATTPVALSYLAYCIAKERRQYREATRKCEAALALEPHNPAHYLNLGRVFLLGRHKRKAFAAFQMGLASGKPHTTASPAPSGDVQPKERELILTELRRMGIRRRLPFSSLPRQHPLNRMAGKALSVLNLR